MQKLNRRFKDQILRHYYAFRIDYPQNPYAIALRRSPYQVLFILSHMRSGSSLLTHLLVTNPDIIGYGETHLNYATESDFKQLLHRVYWTVRGLRMNHTYVLDKLLHDSKLQDPLLQSSHIRAIFLVREPASTLASLLKLKEHWSEAKAVLYYVDRLATLERYAQIINDSQTSNTPRSLFFTYQNLLNDTQGVFQILQEFLDVPSSFSETYDLMPLTGFKGVGDSSSNIKAGRILRDREKPTITVSETALKQSWLAFEKCCATLSQYGHQSIPIQN